MFGILASAPVKITYYKNTEDALKKLFFTNLLHLPSALKSLKPQSLLPNLLLCGPTTAELYFYQKGGVLQKKIITPENKILPFPLHFLIWQHRVYLIKSTENQNKCDFCGRFYKSAHTCNVRRRDFYYHQVNTQSSTWWEDIKFFPLGSLPTTKRLFITYDVETYTWHGQFGKQLVPFMLVIHIQGDKTLCQIAKDLCHQHQWNIWPNKDDIFYQLSPQKKFVGTCFKKLRNDLQKLVCLHHWKNVLQQNPELYALASEKGSTPYEITCEQLNKVKLKGEPQFYEIYIIGHNINGFDEIVLAAQVISNRGDIPTPYKITRNFMPRCGKILFNDITFSLPNPSYQTREDFQLWEQGGCDATDFKHQYVKFMVRDTFALTHTSLKNAAKAYNLETAKGCCPYQAVNEFYRLGAYQKDDDGFPNVKYWQSTEEYLVNKQLWKEKNEHAYDLIQQTLEYCVLDVIVTSQLVKKLQESYQQFIKESVHLPEAHFNIFQRPTISSNSHAMFRQILYRSEKPQKTTMGSMLKAPSQQLYDYIRDSIRGGRCYPTFLGLLEEPIYVYDICGMYASALTHPLPAGTPLNALDVTKAVHTWTSKLQKKTPISYFDPQLLPGIFTVDADPPAEPFLDVLPPFCSRKGGRLCWTNEPLRAEVTTSIDVITLHNRGWTVTILPDIRTTIFPQWKCLAKEYVELNIKAKEKADQEKNQTMRSIAKLLSNALYGSFATKLDNRKVVFSDQMEDSYIKGLATGEYFVKSSSFIETDNLSAEIVPEFVVAYSPEVSNQSLETTEIPTEVPSPIYSDPHDKTNHVIYTYKPITFLDSQDNDTCLHTLEKNTSLIVNNKYSSQIASFVLAWTRAFMSEWCQFLYQEDYGIPLEARALKSVYGDTDSLFLTEKGHQLMQKNGRHRIKKNSGKLVFDEEHPELTWLVECETQCEKCAADAYSSQSVFLAPKLYALKDTQCTQCKHVGKGKLRAKGHATTQLSFDLMVRCFFADQQHGEDKFETSRLSLQRTLASHQEHIQPFTVTERVLTRTLRPWKDKTLILLKDNRMIPYCKSNPNPRNQEVCLMELPWDI